LDQLDRFHRITHTRHETERCVRAASISAANPLGFLALMRFESYDTDP
jgi:hypothetical protein